MSDPSRSQGTGPGVITPDGCAVDFYAKMTAMGEPAIVHGAARPGASILELGCGTGRITHPLVALGHPVVAVDESPEMLAHVRDAETVCARIEDLALGRRFDLVLLASHLINTDDIAARAATLAACRRHVADDGGVIIQQHAPGWFAAAADAENVRDGMIFRMRDVSRPAPDLVSATMEYADGDRIWTQTFTARRLDDTGLAAVLAAAGLRLDRYLTDDHAWLRAVPVTGKLAALAAEGATAGGGAVGAVHLAGVIRALGAAVPTLLALERLAELALHVVEVGIPGGIGLGGFRGVSLGGGLARGRLGSGLLDGHEDLLRLVKYAYSLAHPGRFHEPIMAGMARRREPAETLVNWVETSYGRAELLRDADRRAAWMLLIDGVPQSHVDLEDPGYLDFEYVRRLGHVIDEAAPAGQPLRVLHLGAGALTLARYVAATRPGSPQLAVEVDAALVDFIRARLPLGARIRVRAGDARAELERLAAGSFDVVIVDVFAGGRTPAHLTSAEFWAAARRAVRGPGVVAANVADGAPLAHARAQVATAQTAFPHACLIGDAAVLRGRRFGNLVLAASPGPLPVDALIRRAAGDPMPGRVLHGRDLARFTAGARPVTDATATPSPAAPPGAFAF